MKAKSICFALTIFLSAAIAHSQVTGSGTLRTLPIWTGKSSIGNSKILQLDGNVGVNTKTPGAQLDVESSSTTEPAVVGNNYATTGSTTGVLGLSASPDGTAVAGLESATTGTAIGGYFRTASSAGTALIGSAT